MRSDTADLKQLSRLLDTALDLPPAERDTWLASLTGEDARLASRLRELLLSRDRTAAIDVGAAETLAPAAADTRVGPYRLVREIGSGGMGVVWLAERADGLIARKVALKLPHIGWAPGFAQRFARERSILATLEHPNIARLYDAGLDEVGRPYMALEYVEGEPIDAWCARNAADVRTRIALLLQVVDALAFAHARLVVHRDIKPANILVTAEGQVRLLDFGIAKLVEGDAAAETELTRLSGRALTVQYASPEQIRGEPIGTASDIYSLGVVAYELLAGQRPYRLDRAGVPPEQQVLTAEIPPASTVAADGALRRALRGDFDAILAQALRKVPGERYTTVDALGQDMRAYSAGRPVMARGEGRGYRALRFATRHQVPLAIAAAIAVLFAIGVGAGATALLALVLAVGLGVALWQARALARERDRALRLVERHEAVAAFLNMLITDAARGGRALTAEELLKRSEALVAAELEGDAEEHAMVLSMIGASMQTLGNSAEAIRLAERALVLTRGSDDEDLRDTLISNRALAVGWAGRYEEARDALRGVATRANTSLLRRTEAHHYLAMLANSNNDAAAAVEYAEAALRELRSQRRPSRKLEASMLASLGAACSLNGRLAEADRHFAAAFAAMEALGQGSSAHAVTMLNNWAVVNERAGDVRQSLALAERALALAGDAGRSPFLVINRARALEHLGRLEEALPGYAETVRIATARGITPVLVGAHLGTASVCLERRDLAGAQAALGAADAAGAATLPERHPQRIARLLIDARAALARGDDAAAKAGCDLAVQAAPQQATAVMARLCLCEIALARGDAASALESAQGAKAQATALQGGKPHSFRTALAAVAVARAHAAAVAAEAARAEAREALAMLAESVDMGHPAFAIARSLAGDAPGDSG